MTSADLRSERSSIGARSSLGDSSGAWLWVKDNLFSRWYNTVLTVLLAAVVGYLGYRSILYLFWTAEWEPVRANLTLFMIGSFPRDEQWRIVVQLLFLALAFGVIWGAMIGASRDRAAQSGLPFSAESGWVALRRWWGLVLLLGVLLLAAWGILPVVLALGCMALTFSLRIATMRLNSGARIYAWLLGYALLIASWQIVSGTGGSAWIWAGGLLAFAGVRTVRRKDLAPRLPMSLAAIAVSGAVAWGFYTLVLNALIGFSGVGWDDWAGFHLNLIAATISIIAAFPMGLLLALGRRSSLPAIRWLCVTYIELIRGVPLIGLLFIANSLLGFFIDNDPYIEFFLDTPLSQISRAIVIMSLFTAAYLAEVIRGGLEATPRGQTEAGQSVGLSPWQITSRIVMPQTLRASIPAIVGQFISLLKDSSLLSIIAVSEILRVRASVHSQAAFTTLGTSETLVFIAFAFWAFAFTWSRESQRLEKRLGVGER